MKIGITLDEVLRDFLGQMNYTCSKYFEVYDKTNKDVEVTDFNKLVEFYKFEDRIEFYKFLYDEHSLEIFGHADQLHDNIMVRFNDFLSNIADEEEHEIYLISRETGRAIASTFFFLSKLGCKANNVKFVTKYEDVWDEMDVVITATPQILNSKPEGKKSVKVEASYNMETDSDYTISKLTDFMGSEELQQEILED